MCPAEQETYLNILNIEQFIYDSFGLKRYCLLARPSCLSTEEFISQFNCVDVLNSVAPFKLRKPKTTTRPWLNDHTEALREKMEKKSHMTC